MIRLDRDGLDYLLQVCTDMGFGATRIETVEDVDNAPTLQITLIQTRIAETPKKPQETDQPMLFKDAGETLLDGTKL